MNDPNKLIYQTMWTIYPILFFVLFVATGGFIGEEEPLSLDAFIKPYLGELSTVSIVLLFAGLAFLVFFNIKLLPKYLESEKTYLLAMILPETFAIIGFVIGFMDMNVWAALPYIVVAFLNYVVVYQRISESGK